MKNNTLKVQIICFCVTLILLAVSMFLFRSMKSSDYVLIVCAVLELIGILFTLSKNKKQ